ncbi:restriction endonuclease subunit S, partial [Caldithrix abyssi]
MIIKKGWLKVLLGDIGEIVSGGTPSTKIPEFWNGDIPWITPADLSGYNKKYISHGKKNITFEGLQKSSAKLLPEGSILFSSRAPIGYVVIAKNKLATNQGFKNIIPSKQIFNEYVYYYLKSAKNLAEDFASGTTFKEISAKNFARLPIPLPPLPEQSAIVARIEELFSRLDKGIETLQQVKQQIKVYRQAVLKWAFEGKLTAEWREQQKAQGTLPTAEELLKQIKA